MSHGVRQADVATWSGGSLSERPGTLARHAAAAMATAASLAQTLAERVARIGMMGGGGADSFRASRAHKAPDSSPVETHDQLAELVYELLDAHADTAHLARELPADERWEAHLDFLRALQRKSRELIAEIPAEHVG